MGKTLLLADDSVTIQKVVGISFASEDIAITTVDNGDDAVRKAKSLRPDIVLADVVMPGKSGYEVCQAIKADPALRHIPVLLLTGTFEAFDEKRAAQVGAAGHVAKPFEAQTLVDRVKDLLARSTRAAAPTVAPVAARKPAPASAAPASEDSFDFFDEGTGDVAGAAAAPKRSTAEPSLDDSLDLGSSDAAFAFGEDDFALAPPSSPTPDSTVALLPDERPAEPTGPSRGARPDAGATTLDPAMFAESAPPAKRAPAGDPGVTTLDTSMLAASDAPAAAEDEGFDFAFDADASEAQHTGSPIGSDDLAQATILDPDLGANFAVSSSDLESTASPAAARTVPPPVPPMRRAEIGTAMLESTDLEATDDLLAAEPLDDADEEEFSAFEVPTREPAPEPRAAAAPRAAAEQPGRRAASPAIPTDALVEQIAPALRAELHQTLEKIAWESFGQITEKIVQEVVQRLETVAWDVVPKLAEALIQEEIRKLKGESR
ncbi:MAG: response regulator [Myxococcales bacterium]|nr:response regulator [Myxococcales bacterium]